MDLAAFQAAKRLPWATAVPNAMGGDLSHKMVGKWWFNGILMAYDGIYPPVSSNMAGCKPWTIEISDFPKPRETPIFGGFEMAAFDYRRVTDPGCNAEIPHIV